jgi:hypothetical protein
MFSNPPTTLQIRAHDNLVLDSHGFASAMNSGAGVGTREEKREFLLTEILRLEFLRFNGNNGPLQWIHRCECYFRDCRPKCQSGFTTFPLALLRAVHCGS